MVCFVVYPTAAFRFRPGGWLVVPFHFTFSSMNTVCLRRVDYKFWHKWLTALTQKNETGHYSGLVKNNTLKLFAGSLLPTTKE
jgi:hypothetical protein